MIELRLSDEQAAALNNAVRREMAIIERQGRVISLDLDRTEYLRHLDDCTMLLVEAIGAHSFTVYDGTEMRGAANAVRIFHRNSRFQSGEPPRTLPPHRG